MADEQLLRALAALSPDQFVVWTGAPFAGRSGSLPSRLLALIHEEWTPVSLRELALRAHGAGIDISSRPEALRAAIRSHQLAQPVAYVLVRRTAQGELVTVCDVWSGLMNGRLRRGAILPTPDRKVACPVLRFRPLSASGGV